MAPFDQDIRETKDWTAQPRFEGLTRLYSARQLVEQRGTIPVDYSIARQAAEGFFARLRELFGEGKSITTFGPYSPGQAMAMKRNGIEGIYLGGWATSAKGSITENPGADLASYPLSQVPDEAAPIVRALLAADRNQLYLRSKMSEEERAASTEIDYRPFIIADADTGHGGEAHVRNLIRRFVEVGVPGYHIEDQKPGAKKCGHQGGKVLVGVDEQIKRLNGARFQLDVMKVPGIIVARTDAEAATLLESRGDERDHPFIFGATNVKTPSFKVITLALLKKIHELGVEEINGHLLYAVPEAEYEKAFAWLGRAGLTTTIEIAVEAWKKAGGSLDATVDGLSNSVLDAWQADAGMKLYHEAVADVMTFRIEEGAEFELGVEAWTEYARNVSFPEAREKARELGITIIWDAAHCKTPEGYYQVRGGMEYAIARSIAVAPFADIIWMETKTANLKDAKAFADAIHAVHPEQMLAYNLSPSFNWDTTGMNDEEMQQFPIELGKLGYVFNFITYGGHQIDGVAGEEFATSLLQEGMLALAKVQRKIRLLESPLQTPQTHVGGKCIDACLTATSGRTATTKAMGKGSTQFQHLQQTELPTKVLEDWLQIWAKTYDQPALKVRLRPHKSGSELLELQLLGEDKKAVANVVFATIRDRRGESILSVRDQNTFDAGLRKKRLMTLIHLFLIQRYHVQSVHYVSPSEDNLRQTEKMKERGIFAKVATEVGQIIVASVNTEGVEALVEDAALEKLIKKG